MEDTRDRSHDDKGHYEEIARFGITLIKTCGCGMVHLGIGPVTVKLTREAFGQVAEGVQQARRLLEAPPDSRPSLRLHSSLVKGCVQ